MNEAEMQAERLRVENAQLKNKDKGELCSGKDGAMKKWGGDWRTNLMFVGGGVGGAAALVGAHMLGWHGEFLRIILMIVGFFAGGFLGDSFIYERCFNKNGEPFPRTAKILDGLYAVLVVIDKLSGAAMTIPCIFGRHHWVNMPRQGRVLAQECERCHVELD